MLSKRLAEVNNIRIHSVAFSAVFNIGDSLYANPRSRAIALQREGAIFFSDEDLNFEDYPIFRREPRWIQDERNVVMNRFHHSDRIQVGNVNITGTSQSSIIQVGGISNIHSDGRIKHIRQIRSESD